LQAILQAILPLALWAATPTHLSELAPAGPIELHEALDLYGHLMPGNEDEAAALLDAARSSGSESPGRMHAGRSCRRSRTSAEWPSRGSGVIYAR
jgi:hypothetical protein